MKKVLIVTIMLLLSVASQANNVLYANDLPVAANNMYCAKVGFFSNYIEEVVKDQYIDTTKNCFNKKEEAEMKSGELYTAIEFVGIVFTFIIVFFSVCIFLFKT